jgi:beta-lactam-binding protein with PASTA domain
MPSGRLRLIVGVVAGAILIAIAVIVTMTLRPSVRVPSLVGATRSAAERRAKALGLTLVVKGTELAPDIPKGSVASQDPTAGVVVPGGSSVTVLISAGSEAFGMPDVLGMMLADARELLRASGLDVRFKTAASDAPTGTVTASAPVPGAQVAEGDIVELTISASGGVSVSSDLSGASFVIDPAPPATTGSVDAAYEVATRLAASLRLSGATVVMTRDAPGPNSAPTVDERVSIARESSATVLIGVSVKASGLEGLQVMVMPTAGVAASVSVASGPLADAVFASLRVRDAAVSTITASADPVLTGSGLAGVGVRLGSEGSRSDRKSFADPSWADAVATAISRALTALYGRTP